MAVYPDSIQTIIDEGAGEEFRESMAGWGMMIPGVC